jgi:hypothetical protein
VLLQSTFGIIVSDEGQRIQMGGQQDKDRFFFDLTSDGNLIGHVVDIHALRALSDEADGTEAEVEMRSPQQIDPVLRTQITDISGQLGRG